MEEVISVCISSYNTLSTRKEGLDACLEGLKNSIRFFDKLHPEVKVIISWVDDASIDETYHYVDSYFQVTEINTSMLRVKLNSHQGYCRNLASKLIDSDYIMFCDSDDVFKENHIAEAYELIQGKDSAGRLLGMVSTQAEFDKSLGVYPDWKPRISGTIPITKIIRRDIWEFIEGFPTEEVYRKTGCEDQDAFQLIQYFFTVGYGKTPTVKYKCYPGSFFETQLEKFRQHPNYMTPCKREQEVANLNRIRRIFLDQKLEYLKHKLMNTDWYSKLEKYVTNYT